METEVKLNANDIIARLVRLQASIDYVKAHIDDVTLSEEDIQSLEEAEKEHKSGKTTSLKNLKKELGI
ncbi:MAG: hypothetical protein Q7R87_04970 [Nanoarchaeota archaeon]|nr:hypothetical protein [Nanoarchaeota archaeon]